METSTGRSRPRRVGRSRPLRWRLTDAMWRPLARILVDPPRNPDRPGRPRYAPRQCLEGILYVLSTDTPWLDRKSTRLNSSHVKISYAVFCLKKKKTNM